MKKLTAKDKRALDKKFAQVFKCLVCDENAVRWNGEQWECGDCGQYYGKKTEISLT